ncbi:hypothetical protein Bealeia1_00497 [Candidatus Bealeia paramacronuclearis]|uniref:Uncharacterized protein n=1 Tax=Candidatus Bealeia paramacronuclearis TaxID=1921001 RepID=A0ABZ2C1D9_9PROT|nr:hypothetical protein [Candidatus Bealeia paramacronuclearis]
MKNISYILLLMLNFLNYQVSACGEGCSNNDDCKNKPTKDYCNFCDPLELNKCVDWETYLKSVSVKNSSFYPVLH